MVALSYQSQPRRIGITSFQVGACSHRPTSRCSAVWSGRHLGSTWRTGRAPCGPGSRAVPRGESRWRGSWLDLLNYRDRPVVGVLALCGESLGAQDSELLAHGELGFREAVPVVLAVTGL